MLIPAPRLLLGTALLTLLGVLASVLPSLALLWWAALAALTLLALLDAWRLWQRYPATLKLHGIRVIAIPKPWRSR